MGSKKILIIHPEGNIFNNPNLFAIANYLTKDFEVDVLMPDSGVIEDSKFNIITYGFIWNRIKNRINSFFVYKHFFILFNIKYRKKYDFIFGVDRIGIIDAYLFSQKDKCNYALISYEIFFEDETSNKFKHLERVACKDISFAIVQDELRGKFLSIENLIDINKMLFIPVASDGLPAMREKKYSLHKMFGLEETTKILIFTGSVAKWSCIDEIIKQFKDYLPDNWVFVIHDRYGKTLESIISMNVNSLLNKKIYLTNQMLNSDDLDDFLSDADLGIVSYCPIFSSPYTGKNIQHIGLSSGKFSNYMKNGLPVIVYNSYSLRQFIDKYNIGFYVQDLNEIRYTLSNFNTKNEYSTKCKNFYLEFLNFTNFSELLKSKIMESIRY